jgi:hypothetical protein
VNRASYAQPALIGGLVMGVLSVLPIINLGNCFCCMWVIGGGVVAAYVLQQNQSAPITAGDGALVGLLAGVIGAVVQTLADIPISFLVGPFQKKMVEQILERAGDIPPAFRDLLENYGRGGSLVFVILARIASMMFLMCVGAVFSTLGGLLGTAIFKKQTPPGIIDVTPTTPIG